MPRIIDQIHQTVESYTTKPRVVSLVPSHTETLIDMGIEVVGRTKFCVHPSPAVDPIAIIGGTKNIRIPKILSLEPDLIIANKEENNKEDVELLRRNVPVYTSDVHDLPSSIGFVRDMDMLCDHDASNIIADLESFLAPKKEHKPPLRVLYLIWKDPWMSVGGDTYIHDILERQNLQNVLAHARRYPTIELDEIRALAPELIMLSSEPYPFGEQERMALRELVPDSAPILVDGEAYSWYGTRLIHLAPYLSSLNASLHELA